MIEAEPDVVFPIVHGAFGEDGRLQGLLEMLDLPCGGSVTITGGVAVSVTMTGTVGVAVGPTVAGGVGVAVGAPVGVAVGVAIGVPVSVGVAVGVPVASRRVNGRSAVICTRSSSAVYGLSGPNTISRIVIWPLPMPRPANSSGFQRNSKPSCTGLPCRSSKLPHPPGLCEKP
ncbi:MAG: hypothetical protein OT477_02095 [Chloroflexi bacterium]|nr:hypothetical protein [Chloroflexota bacterium]